jgi:splicing factor 3A subunit 1
MIREIEEALASGKDLSTSTSTAAAIPAVTPLISPTATATATAVTDSESVATKPTHKSIVASSAKAAPSNPIAKLAKIPPKIAPYALDFVVAHPTGVNAVDVDIIKLTAQYTAVNGREFLAGLATREQRNAKFDFLKPTHMLFSYFTSLVDAYAKIVHPTDDLKQRVLERTKQQHVFENAVHRWNWKHSEEERKRSENAQHNSHFEFQAVDWNDFAVVEVIDFGDDELLDVTGLNQLDLHDSTTSSMMANKVGHANGMLPPPAPASSSSSSSMGLTGTVRVPPPPAPPVPPRATTAANVTGNGVAPPRPPPPSRSSVASSALADTATNDANDDEEDDEKIKVVANYKPRIATVAASTASAMTIDPVTGKAMPLAQLEEHMRIQLLDPKWKEEKRRFQERQKETGFAEGVSIADSLKIFAQKRGDIFGQTVSGGKDSAETIAQQEELERLRQMVHFSLSLSRIYIYIFV